MYTREGKLVRGYARGSGIRDVPRPDRINPYNPKAPWYYTPDENALNEELREMGSGLTVDVGGRYGYKALDYYKDGSMQDTLIIGLTKKGAEEAINVIYRYIREIRRHPGEKVELVPGRRYGYTAIDLYRDGKMQDTLTAGLTKKKADDYIWIANRIQGEVERGK
jgi:hypothetical protein